MLRGISLFVVDESSMVPVYAFDAIDRLLRDITGLDSPFGGKIFLWGGDFRQVLPVVRHGRPSDIVENCIKSSKLWPCVSQYQFITNMHPLNGDLSLVANLPSPKFNSQILNSTSSGCTLMH